MPVYPGAHTGRLAGTYLEEHLEQAEYTVVIPPLVLLIALNRQLLV
jgi:hypothetical protein